MGWSEGDRIGITGGLDAPLTTVIKHTKLGQGANSPFFFASWDFLDSY